VKAWPARVAAVVVCVFGFLPLSNWLPGNRSIRWFDAALSEWLLGGAIVIGVGVVLAVLLRPYSLAWRARLAGILRFGPDTPRSAAVAAIAFASFLAYVLVSTLVFDRRPLIIDEIVEVIQARIFASGRLWAPTPPYPEFTAILNVVNDGPKTYGHFPPGGPAILALGELVHAPWLSGPVCAALSVLLMAWLLRAIEPRASVRVLALLLFAFAPFTAFMAGSHMNHVPSLTFLLLGMAGSVNALLSPTRRPVAAFAAGLGFGIAATIRPLDAVAFAVPAGCWYVLRALRDRSRLADLLAAGIGVAIPLSLLFALQAATTGSAFRFGYEVLWGSHVGLGFRGSPWGERHTPLDGLVLINKYFLRLQAFLFEISVPSLLPALLSLALVRKLLPGNVYLLASAGLLAVLYFAYWHDGLFLGPRFFYPLLPVLVLWTARLPSVLEDRFGASTAYWTAVYGGAVALLLAGAVNIPLRSRSYANSFTTLRWNGDSAAAAMGIEGALVLVRESWGAQVIARTWALGVPKGETEQLYRKVDICRLDQAISRFERMAPSSRPTGPAIGAQLRPLMADSARLERSPYSPDTTELYSVGSAYSADCVRRIEEDREGFTIFPPLLLTRGSNIFVRDLHERNASILALEPQRPVYLLRPSSAALLSVPVFQRVSRDSIMALATPRTNGGPLR
jgi:hypothetical protein